jgi:hypothetical protein
MTLKLNTDNGLQTRTTEHQLVTAVWRNGGFSASYDSFVVGSSAVLRLNFCAKNPPHRQAVNRWWQWPRHFFQHRIGKSRAEGSLGDSEYYRTFVLGLGRRFSNALPSPIRGPLPAIVNDITLRHKLVDRTI